MAVGNKKCSQKSPPRLPAVALAAEHLAVVGDGAAAFRTQQLHFQDFKETVNVYDFNKWEWNIFKNLKMTVIGHNITSI
mgnify:CR=1 FL=1